MIKNAGFVAYAVEGAYRVLAIVDQTHLPTVVKDNVTQNILGWSVTSTAASHHLLTHASVS